MSIDYDMALSSNFTDINSVNCMLGDRKSSYLVKQLASASFYKGVPSMIDVDLKQNLLELNEWDYFKELLILNDMQTILTCMTRFRDLKCLVNNTGQVKTISDWREGYQMVKQMSKSDRLSHTYFI